MPNTREKLIEIMEDIDCNAEYCKDCEFANDIDGCVRRQKEIIADHLIANGVTFAEDNNVPSKWIPVTERLPEVGKCVLIYSDTGKVAEGQYTATQDWVQFRWSSSKVVVTHWMPLPPCPEDAK